MGNSKRKFGCLGPFIILCLSGILTVIGSLVVIDKLNMGGEIKSALIEIVSAARSPAPTSAASVGPAVISPSPRNAPKPETKIVEKIVEVPVEKVVEKIVEVEKIPTTSSSYIPWRKIDTAKLWNGIQIQNSVELAPGESASVERKKDGAIQIQMKLTFKIPKPSKSLAELEKLNPELSKMLPSLPSLMSSAKVSPFYHQLYRNKTARIQQKATRLDQILSVHNLYDTETVLELENTENKQKALFIQSEMDVVSDGSDGDRWPFLDNYISMSQYYKPFTSFGWKKQSATPNPLLSRWETNLKKYKERFAVKGLSVRENRFLREKIETLPREISDMKARSYLIAEADPFIVVSLAFLGQRDENAFGPMIGDYAVVIHRKKLYPAIVGDAGPSWKFGEASLRMAREIYKKASPYSRPVSDLSVTYLVFPASREKVNSPPNLKHWHERCQGLLDNLGGVGEGFALHQWEDVIGPKLEEWKKANEPADPPEKKEKQKTEEKEEEKPEVKEASD